MKTLSIDKLFITLISLSNILTTSQMEFKILGLETSIEFILLVMWIFYDLINFLTSKHLVNKYRFTLLLWMMAFLLIFLIELLVKDNFRAFYEINFVILLYSFYQFNKISDFKFLKRLSFIVIILLIILLFTQNQNYSSTNWDYRWVGDEYVSRKSMFGYVSTTLSIILVITAIYIIELYKEKIINIYFLVILLFIIFYYQILTFSRSGLILFFLYLFFSTLTNKNKFFYLLKILLFLIFLFVITLSFEIPFINSYSQIYKHILDNARLDIWINSFNIFINSDFIHLFFGINFFKYTTDNTILAIFIGKGIIGFIIYFFIFYYFVKDLAYKKNVQQIKILKIFLLIILFGFLIMDFFGQRKIIFLSSLTFSTLMSFYEKKYNNS